MRLDSYIVFEHRLIFALLIHIDDRTMFDEANFLPRTYIFQHELDRHEGSDIQRLFVFD